MTRREVEEETGLSEYFCDETILDLDIHPIPPQGVESAHDHYDIRFLCVADPRDSIRISDESIDIRWITVAEVGEFTREESMFRMLRKAGVLD